MTALASHKFLGGRQNCGTAPPVQPPTTKTVTWAKDLTASELVHHTCSRLLDDFFLPFIERVVPCDSALDPRSIIRDVSGKLILLAAMHRCVPLKACQPDFVVGYIPHDTDKDLHRVKRPAHEEACNSMSNIGRF